MPSNRTVHLAAYPVGMPALTDFSTQESAVLEPRDGEIVVRNIYLGVEPYLRSRLSVSSPQAIALGDPLEGPAIGQVEASRHPQFAVGDYVTHRLGWREYSVVSTGAEKIDPEVAPLSYHLGILGGTGYTAYLGMIDAGKPQPGETVFVSAAAGAVGNVAGQLAALHGSRVIGSAGSDDKVQTLINELHFTSAFNYHSAAVGAALDMVCPEGVDLYFDNVGGDHLQAALDHMREFGRIIACGIISQYNREGEEFGLRNLELMFRRSLTYRGLRDRNSANRHDAFMHDMLGWLATGEMQNRETVAAGIEQMPASFIGLFHGANIGKMLVAIDGR